MSVITGFFAYLAANSSQIMSLLLEHIRLTAIAVGVSILIGVPLGIFICYIRKASKPILGIANVIQAVPSMALLGFAIPLLGIGTLPAVVVQDNVFTLCRTANRICQPSCRTCSFVPLR